MFLRTGQLCAKQRGFCSKIARAPGDAGRRLAGPVRPPSIVCARPAAARISAPASWCRRGPPGRDSPAIQTAPAFCASWARPSGGWWLPRGSVPAAVGVAVWLVVGSSPRAAHGNGPPPSPPGGVVLVKASVRRRLAGPGPSVASLGGCPSAGGPLGPGGFFLSRWAVSADTYNRTNVLCSRLAVIPRSLDSGARRPCIDGHAPPLAAARVATPARLPRAAPPSRAFAA